MSHALKTVTIDPHPHLEGTPALSIHPCRHAAVLKLLAEQLAVGGRIPSRGRCAPPPPR